MAIIVSLFMFAR